MIQEHKFSWHGSEKRLGELRNNSKSISEIIKDLERLKDKIGDLPILGEYDGSHYAFVADKGYIIVIGDFRAYCLGEQ